MICSAPNCEKEVVLGSVYSCCEAHEIEVKEYREEQQANEYEKWAVCIF